MDYIDDDDDPLRKWYRLNYGSDRVPEYLRNGTQTDTSSRGKRGIYVNVFVTLILIGCPSGRIEATLSCIQRAQSLPNAPFSLLS